MIFGMCKTKHSSKDYNRCLLIVSKVDIRKRANSLIINFKQVVSFLVWNIYFTFFLSVVDWTFCKSNCKLLSCHVRKRSSRQEVFCKKGVLRNFGKFTGKHLCFSQRNLELYHSFFEYGHLLFVYKLKNLKLHPYCHSFFDHEIQNLKLYWNGHAFFDYKQQK